MPDQKVDLFVIGAGSGGVRAARIAAGYGARVMIAEEHRVGGTCVIRGCVPKKLLVYASRFPHEFEDAEGYGFSLATPTFDWGTLISNKDKEIARLEAAYATNLEKSGVALVKSRAVFEDAHTVRLVATGERVRAANILIATGASPSLGPPIPGIEHVISSNEVFYLREFPRRILIQGGSYIAVEFACIFAGLGAHVHVHRFVDQAALLPQCDIVISHGGAGTLLGAAANGVPHLVLPQGADHFRNGRALVGAGAGRMLSPECQTAAAVRTALAEVLSDGSIELGAKLLAREMAARGVTVNAVSPGFIETDMTAAHVQGAAREALLKSIPLGRIGAATDVAEAVRFLVSREAAYITGQVIRVNGGLLM